MKKFSYFLILLFAASVVFTGCRTDDDDPPPTENIVITQGESVVINGVRWATRNVGAPGTFVQNPEDAGMFFQWNRRQGWAATGTVSGWDSTDAAGAIWERGNDPCPDGWRVPTTQEARALLTAVNNDRVVTVNGVSGRVFGSGTNVLFLPFAGDRRYDGVLFDVGIDGNYWASDSRVDINRANLLFIHRTFDAMIANDRRANGFSVRCVEDDYVPAKIEVADETSLTQTVFADEEEGESVVRFTTTAAWTSSIQETRSVTESWVSITPASGNAGSHNVTLNLDPNMTGVERSAIITITSENATIAINITQKGVDADGNVPKCPEETSASTIIATNVLGNTAQIASVGIQDWVFIDGFGGNLETVAHTPFKDNGFTLELPSLPILFCWHLRFDESVLSISDNALRTTTRIAFPAYNSTGDEIGFLNFTDFDWDDDRSVSNIAFWIYADRDATISGERMTSHEWDGRKYIRIGDYNLDLKKGWNVIYESSSTTTDGYVVTRTYTLTSQRPSGVSLSWRFTPFGTPPDSGGVPLPCEL